MIQINYLFALLDYIFFSKDICHLFKKSATSAGIKAIINCEDKHFIVRLPEDSDEASLEKPGDYFDGLIGDELMDLARIPAEQKQQVLSGITHTAGINIQLQGSRTVYASVSPEILNKVMQYISSDELDTLVCAITEAVET